MGKVNVVSNDILPIFMPTTAVGILDLDKRFVRLLHGMSLDEQDNRLRISSDNYLLRLKETAISDQYFEVAALCSREIRRRGLEKNVSII